MPGVHDGKSHSSSAAAAGVTVTVAAVIKAASTATADRTGIFSHTRERNSPFRRGLLSAKINLRAMRGVRVAGAVSAAVAVFGSLGTATPASASNYGVEVNGTYRATSNGDWARTNDVLINEPTVVQTWIVNSSCTSPISCTGTVKSDQGWTAPL